MRKSCYYFLFVLRKNRTNAMIWYYSLCIHIQYIIYIIISFSYRKCRNARGEFWQWTLHYSTCTRVNDFYQHRPAPITRRGKVLGISRRDSRRRILLCYLINIMYCVYKRIRSFCMKWTIRRYSENINSNNWQWTIVDNRYL